MPVPLNQKRWGGYILAAVVGALTVTTATITTLALTTLTVTNATISNAQIANANIVNASSTREEITTSLRAQRVNVSSTLSGANMTMATANITSASGTTLIFTSASSASMIAGTSAGNRAFTISSTSTRIDFAAVPAGQCTATSSVALPGVTSNTSCFVSVTPSNAVYNSATNTRAEGYALATNTVAVRLCNTDASVATADPADGIYTIKAECY